MITIKEKIVAETWWKELAETAQYTTLALKYAINGEITSHCIIRAYWNEVISPWWNKRDHSFVPEILNSDAIVDLYLKEHEVKEEDDTVGDIFIDPFGHKYKLDLVSGQLAFMDDGLYYPYPDARFTKYTPEIGLPEQPEVSLPVEKKLLNDLLDEEGRGDTCEHDYSLSLLVSETVEDAAKKFASDNERGDYGGFVCSFKKGASWQLSQDKGLIQSLLDALKKARNFMTDEVSSEFTRYNGSWIDADAQVESAITKATEFLKS